MLKMKYSKKLIIVKGSLVYALRKGGWQLFYQIGTIIDVDGLAIKAKDMKNYRAMATVKIEMENFANGTGIL